LAKKALKDLMIEMKKPNYKPPKVYGDKLLKAVLREFRRWVKIQLASINFDAQLNN